MEHAIQEEKVGGYTIKVYPDLDPMNPREDDNATIMVFNNPNYNLGDKHNYGYTESIGDLIDAIKMDHDVLALKAVCICGHVGVAFISKESVAVTHGEGYEFAGQELFNIIDGEVAEYNAYISGDMCGYVVEELAK